MLLSHLPTPERITALPVNEKIASFREMWAQLDDYETAVAALCNVSAPCHLVGHSQGALLARSLVQHATNLRGSIRSLVSLAGPQQGVFSVPNTSSFPIPPWMANVSSEIAYKLLWVPRARARARR